MRLNGVVFNPGEMNIQITLQSKTMVKDAGGAQKPSYTTLGTVWAKWVNAHGNEAEVSGGVMAERPATVTIRYYSSLDETCVLLKGSARYEIVSIDDIRERHEYMEIKCRRMKAG